MMTTFESIDIYVFIVFRLPIFLFLFKYVHTIFETGDFILLIEGGVNILFVFYIRMSSFTILTYNIYAEHRTSALYNLRETVSS